MHLIKWNLFAITNSDVLMCCSSWMANPTIETCTSVGKILLKRTHLSSYFGSFRFLKVISLDVCPSWCVHTDRVQCCTIILHGQNQHQMILVMMLYRNSTSLVMRSWRSELVSSWRWRAKRRLWRRWWWTATDAARSPTSPAERLSSPIVQPQTKPLSEVNTLQMINFFGVWKLWNFGVIFALSHLLSFNPKYFSLPLESKLCNHLPQSMSWVRLGMKSRTC